MVDVRERLGTQDSGGMSKGTEYIVGEPLVIPAEPQSIYNPEHLKNAAKFAAAGGPLGFINRGVCAIAGDGGSEAFNDAIQRIKGEKRGTRPLAMMHPLEEIIPRVDRSRIPRKIDSLLSDVRHFSDITGSLCFFRWPLTEHGAQDIPSSMLSRLADGTPVIQNWDPVGQRPASNLAHEMRDAGIAFRGITSMNISGQPEIVDQQEGTEFSQEHGIYFLRDPKDTGRVKGSYTIFDVSDGKLKLIRDGNIPAEVIRELIGEQIDVEGAKKALYAQEKFPDELIQGLDDAEKRIAYIMYLKGHSVDRIRRGIAYLRSKKNK